MISEEHRRGICLRCDKELFCDIPFVINGVKGFKSAPHGCPEEFDHHVFYASEIGISDEEIDEVFSAVSDEDGGDL